MVKLVTINFLSIIFNMIYNNVILGIARVFTIILSKDQKTSYLNLLQTQNELMIHLRNLQVLMTEIYKIVNGVSLPIMNSFFEFQNNKYNI